MLGYGAHFIPHMLVRNEPIFFITSTVDASAGVLRNASNL